MSVSLHPPCPTVYIAMSDSLHPSCPSVYIRHVRQSTSTMSDSLHPPCPSVYIHHVRQSSSTMSDSLHPPHQDQLYPDKSQIKLEIERYFFETGPADTRMKAFKSQSNCGIRQVEEITDIAISIDNLETMISRLENKLIRTRDRSSVCLEQLILT
ncbi:hypothetical protein ACHWQZ_G012920 [Mnemiopsis leidyi]